MSARDDYPFIAGYTGVGSIAGRPHQTPPGKEFAAALDEIDRLRDELRALRLIHGEAYIADIIAKGGAAP